MASTKKLYRSEKDKMVAGVAGGLADYLSMDATIIRLGFAIVSLFWGAGVLIYIAMWVIVPTQSNVNLTGSEAFNKNVEEMKDSAKQAGEFVKNKVEEVTEDKNS